LQVTEDQYRDKHYIAKVHYGTKVSIAKPAGLVVRNRRAALATGKISEWFSPRSALAIRVIPVFSREVSSFLNSTSESPDYTWQIGPEQPVRVIAI
jgi:hypothetical protein